MTNEQYLISELAEKAGVSVRTIRYYISEGLLPSPEVRGRYSVYDEDYLKRIRIIMRLKEAYLPIKEIRKKLETLTEAELEDFLQHYEQTAPAANDALDYIASVLEPRLAPMQKPVPAPAPARSLAEASINFQPKMVEPEPPAFFRIVLAPGLELLVSDTLYTQSRREIQALISHARQLFTKSGSA